MTVQKATNISWHQGTITKADRQRLFRQKAVVLWFTGLSASGKSTLAHAVERELFDKGHLSFVLDGDNIRHGLNKNLGFSPQDREENIRRIGEVAKLFSEAGLITITAFISPYRADRDAARKLLKAGEFIEIYVKAPLQVLEDRDPKGLYSKARRGEIKEFTGISAPYEEPLHPELIIDTSRLDIHECIEEIMTYLRDNEIIREK